MLKNLTFTHRLFTALVILMLFGSQAQAQAEITLNASAYGLSSNNTPDANRLALQSAINANKEGNLDVLRIDSGYYSIDGAIDISGWNGLSIIGEAGAVINTQSNTPIFKAVLSDASVLNGSIKNITLSSSYVGTANFYQNPALFFIGGTDFHDFVFDNVEFTAPNTSVNGFFAANEQTTTTERITFINSHFHHLGRMGAEFINHFDSSKARFFDITFDSNRFSHIGLVADSLPGNAFNAIALSLSGPGDGAKVINNEFGDEIAVTNIEDTGLDNIEIRGNRHNGNKGSMYRFSNTWVVSNVVISNEHVGTEQDESQFVSSYFANVENVRISDVTSRGNWIIQNASDIVINDLSLIGNNFGVISLYEVVDGLLIENSQLKQTDSGFPVFVLASETHSNVVVRNSCLEQENELYTLSATGGPINVDLINITSNCDDLTVETGSDEEPPTAPQLSVTELGDGSAVLEWTSATDNVGISHYVLYQDGAHGIRFSAEQNTHRVTGLTNDQAEVFMVRAFDAAGNQKNSNDLWVTPSASVTVDDQPPTAPQLSVTEVGDGFAILQWTAATDNVGVSHYVLYQDGAHGIRLDAGQSTYRVTGLINNQAEVFMVRAFDAAGNQRNSNDIWATAQN